MSLFQQLWVERQGSLQDIFYIPAWSTICATHTRLLQRTIGPIHFSHSHSTILRWDLKLWCPGDEESLGSPTQALKHTTPSTTRHDIWVMRWQWRSLLWKDVLGHWISWWFATSSARCRLLPGFAFWAVHWHAGRVQLGPWWLDTCGGFLRREKSGHEAGCSCWCSYGFMSSLIPPHHSGDRMEGDSGALRCKLVIKQVGLTKRDH